MFFRKKKRKYYIKEKPDSFELEDMSFGNDEEDLGRVEYPFNKKLLDFFWYLCALMLLGMFLRVVDLSVVKGNQYRQLSQNNKTRSIVIKAPRGKIYDRFGNILVHNLPSLDISVNPVDLSSDDGELERIATLFAEILGKDKNEIKGNLAFIKSKAKKPVILFENITEDQALIIAEKLNNVPGINIDKTAIRDYVDSTIFSHILGYEGKIRPEELEQNPDYLLTDSIGKQGIEKSYEKYLRGRYGAKMIEVDSKGNFTKELQVVPPVPGSDLVLNIDAELQKKVFDVLRATLDKEGLKEAVGVAMDPRSGEVLAMVSIPSFDNNLFSGGISADNYQKIMNDPLRPMFNRALSGEYPPGSTIKPLIATAALTERVIDENTRIESRGGIEVGGTFFGDWKVHGFTDVRQAIAVSSDVFFYSVGGGYGNVEGLGMTRMKKYDEMFGFGRPTGIDLPNEESGFVPDEDWKLANIGEKWYKGNSYHAAIGQGYVTTTPIQLARYISAIANGGTLYRPRVVSQIKNGNGQTADIKPEIENQNFIEPRILKIVQEGMRMTVTEGTAQGLKDFPVEVAGKTGTAQYGSNKETHGWFVSYAPYQNAEIVLVILVEGQTKNSYIAVPATKEIYDWYFRRKNNK